MSNLELASYPLEYVEFLPDGQPPMNGIPLLSDTVIIVGNHLASSVYREDGQLGDAGRKARALSNRMRYPVIAYNHIGTGPNAPNIVATANTIDDISAYTGYKLAEIVAQRGFKKAILGGNSSDGAMAVGLAASETLPVTHLAAMDPVALHRISLARGFTRWLHFNLREERSATKKRPIDDIEAEATGFVASSFRKDSKAYRRVWESNFAGNGLKKLASNMGGIAMRVELAEHTFVGRPAENQALLDNLIKRRARLAESDPDAAPLAAITVANNYHSTYEDFRHYANCVAKVINPDFAGFDY